jgi:hypothetical protein
MILGTDRSNDRQTQSDWGVTNSIRADPRNFTGTYGSVEKDTVTYGSGTWVHMTCGSSGRDTVWYVCY